MNQLLALADEDPDEAVRQATEILNKDPDDVIALFVVGAVYSKAERFGFACAFLKRLCDLRPNQANCWSNYGLALAGICDYKQALGLFEKAWKLDKSSASAANVAMAQLNLGEWRKALEWAERAISINPESKSAKTTRGMAKLALGDYSGWADNKHSIGGKFRKQVQYQDEPMWEGQKVGTLVAYGEQGIGDEVLYASCLEDAKTRCDTLIVECDKRLEGLFKRSFPFAEVQGTRRVDEVFWPSKHRIDASVPVGRLPEFFRPDKQSFPRKPFLTADPERRMQWRALFNSWGKKPKIGICWSGGSKYNHPTARQIGLEAFKPLMDAIDADWISLQYKDPSAEIEASGLNVRHFKRATLTDDYDDTAGLVAELDMVIGVHTSVQHLAGGLGVPSVILVPEKTIWLYANEFPWYDRTQLFRQHSGEKWSATIKRLKDKLCAESFPSKKPDSSPAPVASLPPSAKRLECA